MTAHHVSYGRNLIKFQITSLTVITATVYDIGDCCKLNEILTIEVNAKVKVEIFCTCVRKEVLTGRNLPMIAVLKKVKHVKGKRRCIVFCLDILTKKFVPVKQFELSKSIYRRRFTIQIVDGPSVVLLSLQNVHVFENTQGSSLNEFTYPIGSFSQFNSQDIQEEISECKIVTAQYLQEHDSSIVMVSIKDSGNPQSLVCLLYNQGEFTTLEPNTLIPGEYHSVCSSLLACKFNTPEKCDIILGTTEGYVVHLREGKWIKCKKIVDGPILEIKKRDLMLDPKRGVYLVQCDGQAIVLDQNFEVLLREVVHFSFVGDFLKNSSEQFLFVQDVEDQVAVTLLDNKIMTVTDSVSIPNGEACSKTVHKALKQRKERDELMLDRERMEVRRLDEFLSQMINRHFTLSGSPWNNMEYSGYQSTLLPLVKGDDPTQPNKGILASECSNVAVSVEAVWQRIYNGRWCIGADVTCKTDRKLIAWMEVLPDLSSMGHMCKSNIVTFESHQSAVSNSQTTNSGLESRKEKDKKKTSKNHLKTEAMNIFGDNSDSDVALEVNFPKPKKVKSKHKQMSKEEKMNSSTGHILNSQNYDKAPVKEDIEFASEVLKKNAKGYYSSCCSTEPLLENLTEPSSGLLARKGILTCMQHVPAFGFSDKVKMTVILKWKIANDTSEVNSDVLKSARRVDGKDDDGGEIWDSRTFTQYSGDVELTVEDVLQRNFDLNFSTSDVHSGYFERLRDVTAWKCLQEIYHLEVRGYAGVISQLPWLLESRCGFRLCTKFDCYITDLGTIREVQVELGLQSSDEYLDLNVYASSDDELYLLVHHLYSKLPDKVFIVAKETSDHLQSTRCLQVLQKEAHLLSHGLRKLLNDHEENQAFGDCDEEADDDLRKVGEKFKRRQERLKLNEGAQMNVSREKFKHFQTEVIDIRKQTDLIFTSCWESALK